MLGVILGSNISFSLFDCVVDIQGSINQFLVSSVTRPPSFSTIGQFYNYECNFFSRLSTESRGVLCCFFWRDNKKSHKEKVWGANIVIAKH